LVEEVALAGASRPLPVGCRPWVVVGRRCRVAGELFIRFHRRTYFEIGDEPLTSFQLQFLAALRLLVDGRLRPYCAELDGDGFLLGLDIDAPGAPKGQESELIASGFVRGRGSFAT
jgi:hypothetical protein